MNIKTSNAPAKLWNKPTLQITAVRLAQNGSHNGQHDKLFSNTKS